MKIKITAVLTIVVLLISLVTGCGATKPAAPQAPAGDRYVPVEVSKVEKKSIANLANLSGKVYADKEVVVLPKAPGKISSVSVKVGDAVKEGQELYTLNSEDAQKQVETSRAALNTAKSAFDMAKANYELNNERFQNAKLTLERTKALYESGAVAKKDYEAAQLAASDKQMDAYKAQLSQSQATYTQSQVSYNQAVQNLDNTYVKSPMDGVVSSVNVQVGAMTSNVQIPVAVVNMDKVNVVINVTEDMVKLLTINQDIKVDITGASKTSFNGKVTNISPAADSKTQLYPVKIDIDNKDKSVKPGMFAKIGLNTDVRQNALIINSEAIVSRNGKNFVYIVENERAVQKEVSVGLDTGNLLEIKTGLNEGDTVIIKGQNLVQDKARVKIVRGDK